MCGRFEQYSSRDEYFDSTGLAPDQIAFDPEPIGRFNVAPGTKVLLLSECEDALHLDSMFWGYGRSGGISRRSLTLATKRLQVAAFTLLWHRRRASVG